MSVLGNAYYLQQTCCCSTAVMPTSIGDRKQTRTHKIIFVRVTTMISTTKMRNHIARKILLRNVCSNTWCFYKKKNIFEKFLGQEMFLLGWIEYNIIVQNRWQTIILYLYEYHNERFSTVFKVNRNELLKWFSSGIQCAKTRKENEYLFN